MALILSLIFIISIYAAQVSGHWKSSVSENEFRMRLRAIDTPVYSHPGVSK
jgi:hypothetical protein